MFVPCIVNPNINNEKKNRKKLLFGKGVLIMCNSIKGSEIGINSKSVSDFGINDFSLDDFIPQDKEIISVQFAPNTIIGEEVSEWLAVVTYKK